MNISSVLNASFYTKCHVLDTGRGSHMAP